MVSHDTGLSPIPYVAIEGNVGAGKSTFLSHFSPHFAVQPVYEPHERWQAIGGTNLLDRFYQDSKRWAYTFQSCAFITRLQAQEELARKMTAPFQLIERSVFCDRYCFAKNCYEMGMMQELEWRLYVEWFEWLVDSFKLYPLGIIYLRTDPEVAYERVYKRACSEESRVSFSYIESLHKRHEAWLVQKEDLLPHMQRVPMMTLDIDEDFVDNDEKQQYIKVAMRQFFDQLGFGHIVNEPSIMNEGVTDGRNEYPGC